MFQYEKTEYGGEDLVISGWESGIAPSPHKGIAIIQNANISTETQEVMASYGRIQQSQANASVGTLAYASATTLTVGFSGFTLIAGTWITVSSSSDTGALPNAIYYVSISSSGTVSLASYYKGAILNAFSVGLTASFTMLVSFGIPIAKATEYYNNGTEQNRYYILDNQGLVWVYDTNYSGTNGITWFLPDPSVAYFAGVVVPSGIAVLNGWIFVFASQDIYAKPTADLGYIGSQSSNWTIVGNVTPMMSILNSSNPHFAFVGHENTMYYTDGRYLGSIFPNSTRQSGVQNVQSYCTFTSSSTTGTITGVISGSLPTTGVQIGGSGYARIPAVFFPQSGFNNASALTTGVVYYIAYDLSAQTFQVFPSETSASAINITSGATGTRYFNTFYPLLTHAGPGGDTPTCDYSPVALTLPSFETSQCMTEIGTTLLIGCGGNFLYLWDQINPLSSGFISLPESNVASMINVNNMAYIFAGFKGNVYISNGSVASLVTTVPDYCAGIAGTPSSYIEPYFVWGDSMYLRGRVYFSILDQTSTKAGNCGGIWSFIPTQNYYVGQDTGIGLRLENQSSYGTYNGYSRVLIPAVNQEGISPQYWSGWQQSITALGYGIDFTAAHPTSTTIIETDAIPTGTMLDKKTFKQVEYKLATALANGETIELLYRQDLTSAYTTLAMINEDNTTALSGYFPVNFQKGQWLQIQIILNPLFSTSTSFCRLNQLRIR